MLEVNMFCIFKLFFVSLISSILTRYLILKELKDDKKEVQKYINTIKEIENED